MSRKCFNVHTQVSKVSKPTKTCTETCDISGTLLLYSHLRCFTPLSATFCVSTLGYTITQLVVSGSLLSLYEWPDHTVSSVAAVVA